MYLWDADWLNSLIRFRYVGSTTWQQGLDGTQGNKVIFFMHHAQVATPNITVSCFLTFEESYEKKVSFCCKRYVDDGDDDVT